MDKVYIVTTGEYSDYGIARVFLKKEIAERYAATVCGNVEEYDFADDATLFAMDNNEIYWRLYMRCRERAGRGLSVDVWCNRYETLHHGPKTPFEPQYFYSTNGDKHFELSRVLSEEADLDNPSVREKYEKIAKDAYAHLQSLIQTEGWTVDMANEWLKEKYGSA